MALSPTVCSSCNTPNRAGSAFCNNCGSSLTGGGSPSGLTGRLASGQVLKQRYRIIQIVGQGGMGAVYKAEDIQFSNRLVAVKEMRQTGLDPQGLKEAADAFKQEADLLAGLRHQNLPRIYDHFSENGRWYLVMDFIEGETLAEHRNKAKEKVLPVPEVLDIGIQLSKVLGYLHTLTPNPVIFRDLSPSNVMLTPDGHVYLIDFGIARFFKPGQAKDTAAYGKAGYSSPEQYGKAQTTPQSDIFSLGATLHEMLSGNDPSNNTPNPYTFPPLPKVSAELERLIEQMLQMNSTDRPTSMAAVKQELERIEDQRRHPPVPPPPPVPPTKPAPPPPPVPQKKGVTRRNVIIGLIVVLVIISSVAIIVAKNNLGPAPEPNVGPTAPAQTTTPTSAPVQNATWNVILNNATSSLTYNNYNVNDAAGHHFLVVTLSFDNNTSQTLPINGTLLDLQDSTSNHYSEDQASAPQQTLYVNAGQSLQAQFAFVVPDSQCQYTLVFTDPTGAPTSWTITVTGAYCTG